MCLVSCMILLCDFRSYFRLLIDEMTISELNWVMPSGFQSLRLFCVFAHMGEESVVLQNRIWRKICVFPVVFSDYPRCAYIFIITTCGRASSTKFIPWSSSPAASPICAKAPEKPRTCKVGRTRQVHQLQDVSNYWAARWWMHVFRASYQRWNWSWYLLDYHWRILCVCKPWIPIGSFLSAALFSNNTWNKLFLREVQGLDSSPKWYRRTSFPLLGLPHLWCSSLWMESLPTLRTTRHNLNRHFPHCSSWRISMHE